MNPRPKRGDTWVCPKCSKESEEGRAYCVSGCGTPGPLAPKPRPAEPEGATS